MTGKIGSIGFLRPGSDTIFQILNYTVTSNHIHLLVFNEEDVTALPRSIQLVAGRTAQEYNQRKNRKGAFWEDRYHVTVVATDKHLLRCMLYIV